jgi:hypothetical protein
MPVRTRRRTALTLALVLLAGPVACRDAGIDRDRAVADAIAATGGRLTPEQAGCYVDRVLDELGAAPLRPGADIPPEQRSRLTTIRVDCVGPDRLGWFTAPPPPDRRDPAGPGAVLPDGFGDDPVLDERWRACEAGFGAACDELFAEAPVGSAYEAFGVTCGDRTPEPRCADVYPAPGVTLPSPTQPTTTSPPPAP